MSSRAPKLSLCMIVRDEADMLPDCLKSVAGVVDEIIIVDTGSQDETLRIAAEHDAKILSHVWEDDFSKARNVSLAAAAGEWILWIDADERLRPAEHDRLRRLIETRRADAFLVPIRSKTPTGCQISRGHRLFCSHRQIRFSGRIHEQVSASLSRIHARIGLADFTIDHLGYDLDEEKLKAKFERNLRMLLASREQEPRNAYIRFTIGQLYMQQGRLSEAEFEIKAALGEAPSQKMRKPLPPDIRAAAHNNLAQCALARGAPHEALTRSNTSLAIAPVQRAAHLMAYRAYKALGTEARALRELMTVEASFEKGPKPNGTAIEIAVDRSELWRAMGHSCLKLQRPEQARGYFLRALDTVTERSSTLAALARCAIAEGKLDGALARAEEALRLAPEDDSLLDLVSFILLKQERFESAAERLAQLSLRRPQDQTVRRRLAGVLIKAGRVQEAAAVAADINGLTAAKDTSQP